MKNYVKQDAQGNLSIHTVDGFTPTDAICELPAGIPLDEADTLDVVGNTVVVNPTKKAAHDAAKIAAATAKATADAARAARLARLQSFDPTLATVGVTEIKAALKDLFDQVLGR